MKNKDLEVTSTQRKWDADKDNKRQTNICGLDFYTTTDLNEAMWAGDQWKNTVRVPGAAPVFNEIKTSGNYIISTVMSSKRTARIGLEGMPSVGDGEMYQALDVINKHLAHKWEKFKFDQMQRGLLKDSAITGDMATHTYWDPTKDTNQPKAAGVKQMGDFVTERVYTNNIALGNPNTPIIDGQPYVIVSGRYTLEKLRSWCKDDKQRELIVPDDDYMEEPGDRGKIELDREADEDLTGKARAFFYYYKKDGVIWCKLETKYAQLYDKKLKLTRYPVVFGNWEERMNSCHGQPFVSALVSAQRFVNKEMAVKMKHMIQNALGKMAIDITRVNNYDNEIDSVIKVEGSIDGAVQALGIATADPSIPSFIEMTINMLRNAAGANDVAQGLVSAKSGLDRQIAVTQATLQLNSIQANLEQFIEDQVLVWADFITGYYLDGRQVSYTDDEGDTQVTQFNGQSVRDALFTAKVDVGPSNLVTELTSIETLNNLLSSGKISDVEYFERLPEGTFPKQKELLEARKQAMQQQQQQAQPQPAQPDEFQAELASMTPEELQILDEETSKAIGGL